MKSTGFSGRSGSSYRVTNTFVKASMTLLFSRYFRNSSYDTKHVQFDITVFHCRSDFRIIDNLLAFT